MTAITEAALVLALCLTPGWAAAPQTQQTPKQEQQTEPPKPEPAGTPKPVAALPSVDNNTYTLGSDDVISVKVWREPDLSGSMVVRPDGKITMPLINEVQAGGLTPVQLGDEIAKMLSKFVNSPQVMVLVETVRSKRYYLTGDGIARPGAYPLSTPTTVFDAITMAGGFREFANKKNITIMRGEKRLKFNWNEVIKGKNVAQNIDLENGDRVVVQ